MAQFNTDRYHARLPATSIRTNADAVAPCYTKKRNQQAVYNPPFKPSRSQHGQGAF